MSTRRPWSLALAGALLVTLGSPSDAAADGPARLLPVVRVRLLAEGHVPRLPVRYPAPSLVRGRVTVEVVWVLPGAGRSPLLPNPTFLRRLTP